MLPILHDANHRALDQANLGLKYPKINPFSFKLIFSAVWPQPQKAEARKPALQAFSVSHSPTLGFFSDLLYQPSQLQRPFSAPSRHRRTVTPRTKTTALPSSPSLLTFLNCLVCWGLWSAKRASFALLGFLPPGINGHSLDLTVS